MGKTKKNAVSVILIITFILLVIYSIVMISVLLWGGLTSLKSFHEFEDLGNVFGLPSIKFSKEELLLGNYKVILDNLKITRTETFYSLFGLETHQTSDLFTGEENSALFGTILLNTVIYVGGGAIIAAIVPYVTAYICAKYKNIYTKTVYTVALVVMATPIIGNTPSTLVLLQNLNLYDSFLGNFIQKFSFTGMYFLVFCAFFSQTPDTYMEAAEIDGASQLNVMVNIMLPLAGKMLATVILLDCVTLYNDYTTQLMYMPTKPTLSFAVYYMNNIETGNAKLGSTPVRIASCMMLSLPMILVFIFLHNKLMGNVSLGGLKE